MPARLAYIGRIVSIDTIPDAERVELARVVCGKGGIWTGVVKKSDFVVGDKCEVYVQDALLPDSDVRFEFLGKNKRIKMRRFMGAPSECLIMPLSPALNSFDVGEEISEIVGVVKYEKILPAHLAGYAIGSFPSFIPKTDEPNFQSVPDVVNAMRGEPCYATVKYDGTSCTAYVVDGKLHVCSRNLILKKDPSVAHWRVALENKLEIALQGTGFAIQFEVIGPKIQGNPIGLKNHEMRAFSIYDIENAKYVDSKDFFAFCRKNNIPAAEIVFYDQSLNYTDEGLRALAERTQYPNGHPAEGIVIRTIKERNLFGNRGSFKVINLMYKS